MVYLEHSAASAALIAMPFLVGRTFQFLVRLAITVCDNHKAANKPNDRKDQRVTGKVSRASPQELPSSRTRARCAFLRVQFRM